MGHTVSWNKYLFYTSVSLLLAGCESTVQAPVEELRPQFSMNHANASYTVRPGDTLFAIAFLFDQNVEQLARLNHLSYPYRLRTGQVIRLTSHVTRAVQHVQASMPRLISRGAWAWPAQGRIKPYAQNPIESKGLNILGTYGQTITAAQSGVVAYAGNGLPGYGLLILIKHEHEYLTAYAFNAKIFVKEGQMVQKGQRIASMGYMSPGIAGLHFEIRYRGVALAPRKFL